MPKEQSSYRQIFKATSLFGGVQVFNILITIIRGKVVAVLLGTAGMGINGLFLSTIALIRNFSSLGLPESAVKNISGAKTNNDYHEIEKVTTVFRYWIWFTAIFAVLLTVGLSHFLSEWTFDSEEYTYSFMILSFTFFFTALSTGTYTILRGLRRLKYLATANILGAFLGLLIAVPFYYFYGIDGILPAIIASAAANYIISLYFANKIKVKTISLTLKEIFYGGLDMARLGVVLSFTAFLTSGVTYAIITFISNTGTISDVGLYSAGVTITTSYVGMVFTAMATDYFPRLSASIHDKKEWGHVVLHQGELTILILTPILIFLMGAAPFVIKILLSVEFLPVLDYIQWAILGLFLQGIVWTLGFIIVAKGDLKIKLYTEIAGKLVLLGFNMVGYVFWGLEGLGMAFLLSNIFGLILLSKISCQRYRYYFPRSFIRLSFMLFFLCISSFLVSYFIGYPIAYFIEGLIFLIATSYCLYHLNDRLNLKNVIKGFRNKFFK